LRFVIRLSWIVVGDMRVADDLEGGDMIEDEQRIGEEKQASSTLSSSGGVGQVFKEADDIVAEKTDSRRQKREDR